MITTQLTCVVGLTSIAIWLTWNRVKEKNKSNPKGLPLPPGPPQLPILGNLFNYPISSSLPWESCADLAKKYGDVMYFNVLGQRIVMLSSIEAANEVFEKRSAIYSSRAKSVMLDDLVGMGWMISAMPYGERWRKTRRIFHQYFNIGAVHHYQEIQLRDARSFLKHLHENPERFFHHIRHSFASTIMKAVYDIDVKEEDDPYIDMAEKALEAPVQASQPGRFYVEVLPILKYVPAWFPGAEFKRLAARSKFNMDHLRKIPLDFVKENMKAGLARPSVALSMLEKIADSPNKAQDEVIAGDAASIAYVGGADTTVSAVQCFFLAMLLHPEVQKKGQEELAAVVGPDRLPTFSDKPSLPYIESIVKEVLRWHLVTPLALPHLSTADDEIRGFFIPKGTVVIGNAWAILHDPVEYPDPHLFKPERFLTANDLLDPNVQDPEVACFGFGRRICPGRFLARNSLFILISSILHTYNIAHMLDERGQPIDVQPAMTSGLISYPLPFPCDIKPRSAHSIALINNEAVE